MPFYTLHNVVQRNAGERGGGGGGTGVAFSLVHR